MKIYLALLALLVANIITPAHAIDVAKDAGKSPLANTPIKNLRLPTFNEKGYRTHLLTGEQATYISATQIDITGLSFTQYPGDGSAVVEARITAPRASVFAENKQAPRVTGKESVHLEYENELNATGENWTYDHAQKKITIRQNAQIVYEAPLKNIIAHTTTSGTEATASAAPTTSQNPQSAFEKTTITSTSLELTQNETDGTTLAIFNGNVIVITEDDLRLTCDHLEVTAAHLADKNPALQPLDKFQLLVATGNVRITQGARTITCGRADVLPREDRITLTQNASVTDTALRITALGDPLTLYRTDKRIEGKNVRITLPAIETSGATPNAAATDTLVTANNYVMWETTDGLTHANLDGAVTVTSPDTHLTCERLELIADTQTHDKQTAAANAFTSLQRLLATGNVHVVQGDREATCNLAEILPREDKITLTQSPVLTDHAASSVAKGDTFVLHRLERRMTGQNVQITLPPLKDLSATASAAPAATTTSAPTAHATPDTPTTITSATLTMWTTPDEISHATFDDDVRVTATNLTLNCDHLTLTADTAKRPAANAPLATTGTNPDTSKTLEAKLSAFRYMLATGHVRFTQLTREAICERAEVFPQEDRITLTGKPVITDRSRQMMATGDKLTLIRGQQDIQGENIRITAPPIKVP